MFCYCSSYLPKQLAANSGMYNRPLENPQENAAEGFLAFVLQCLEGIKEKYVSSPSVIILKETQYDLHVVI